MKQFLMPRRKERSMSRKLYRNPDGKFMGVCSGLAEYLRMDVGLVRLVFIILAFVTGGAAILAYIAMGIFLPIDDYRDSDSVFDKMKGEYWDKRNFSSRSSRRRRGRVDINDIKNEFDNLKSRVSNMEDSVFNKERDWDERFKNS